ncbi:MAG: methylmalonyl-CoA decarboxylase [Syntrophobacteraceae bacterium]
MSLIEKEIRDNVGLIRFCNPGKKNALNRAMALEVTHSLEELKRRKVPVVVLGAAEGCSVWSAGVDISELPRCNRDPLAYDDALERLLRAVQHYHGPVIAMVRGGVWGGACDLAMTCDMIVGDETCTFAITPAKLGLPYNASGILHFINRLGLNVAKEMFFSAEPISAEHAERVGILNHLVPSDRLLDFTMDLAARIARRSALAISVIKEQFRILAGAHPLSPDAFERIQALRRHVYDSHDYEEGIRAFLEKREPVFKGE